MLRILECQKCGHIWPYTGGSTRYCICPSCRTSVKVDRKIPIVWDHQDIHEHAGKGYFSIEIWNGKVTLLINIISQDGNHARLIPLDLRTIGITQADLETSIRHQGGRIAVSGILPIDRTLKNRLKTEMGEPVKTEAAGQTVLLSEET